MFLFVYGTLMSQYCNNYLLKSSKYIGKARTKNKYSLHISGTIPFLHDDENIRNIEGELYEISNDTLKEIDILESNGEWYNRREISVILESNKSVYKALTYFNNDSGIRLNISFDNYMNNITKEYYKGFI